MELKKYIIGDYSPDDECCQYDYYEMGKDGVRPTKDMAFNMEAWESNDYKDGIITKLLNENRELKEKIKKVS
tara:strand:+ start:75 stop:290 length:216 start_codon:yes stop_codon:yes gene_type:complete